MYSSNDREWHVYTQGTLRPPVKERTPIAEKGWWKFMMSKGKVPSKERNVFLQSDIMDLKKNGKSFSWKLYRCSSTPLIFSRSDIWYDNLRVRTLTVCPRLAKRVLSSYKTRSAPPITLAIETSATRRIFRKDGTLVAQFYRK